MRKFGAIVFTAIMLAVLVKPNMVSASASSSEDHALVSARPDQKTLDRLAAAVEKNPSDVDARCALAACYESLGLPDLAQEQYSAAIQVAPNDAHVWMLRVKQALKSGQATLATKLIEKAHERFADDPEVLFWYGNVFASKSKNDDAAIAYQLALKQNAKVEGLRSALAEVCLEKSRFGDALILANEELALHPDFALGYKVKGFALMGLRKPNEAIPPLRIAYLAFKNQPLLQRTYAHACSWCGLYDEALEPALAFLKSTSNLTSNDPGAKRILSTVLENLPKSKVQKELPDLVKKMQTANPNAAFFFALGDILDRTGENRLAMDYYTLGLKMEPRFARGLFRLGKDYELVNADYNTALKCYQAAYELNPDDPEVGAYFSRLNQRIQTRSNDIAWQLKDWLRR